MNCNHDRFNYGNYPKIEVEVQGGNVDASINRVWTNACHRLLLLRFQDMPGAFGIWSCLQMISIMIHGKVWKLWFIHTARDWARERDQEQWISILCYALYTLYWDWQWYQPTVSFCVSLVPCTGPGPVHLQCD